MVLIWLGWHCFYTFYLSGVLIVDVIYVARSNMPEMTLYVIYGGGAALAFLGYVACIYYSYYKHLKKINKITNQEGGVSPVLPPYATLLFRQHADRLLGRNGSNSVTALTYLNPSSQTPSPIPCPLTPNSTWSDPPNYSNLSIHSSAKLTDLQSS